MSPRSRASAKKAGASERLFARVVKLDSGCWEWQGYRMPFGHGQIQGDDGKVTTTHRVAWSSVHGPVPEGLVVRHRCDNPPCCNPDHLEVGTAADNTNDALVRGRFAVGERHPNTRLTDQQVHEIRAEYRVFTIPGRRGRHSNKADLAERYGVSKSHIKEIVAGRERTHV